MLSRGHDEWVGVDLASGAFVRVPGGIDAPIDDETRAGLAVEFIRAIPDGSPDPSRPEVVIPATVPAVIATPRSRSIRRYLERLATPESNGATILGTRGPSIAFIDLDGTAASIQLLAIPAKKLELSVSERGAPVCSIPWGGTTQRIRIADDLIAQVVMASAPRALHGPQITAAIGARSGFVLVGLGRVTGGHASKLVLALL
ncbi:MAG TPA: hypothetical protein VG368_05635 [Acidimicrobiales bacterium]|nr:hypothetical protein [Acidimicrobiales bacterium]